jgi:TonB family protein
VVPDFIGQTSTMSMILIALLQAVAEPAVPPQRIPSTLLSPGDYPTAAMLLGQDGLVEAEMTVAANGRPSDCSIVRSSGFQALDTATCTAFKTRARFKPALDTLGRPTIGKWTQTVQWSIEGNELPLASWTIRLLVGLDKNGSPTNCAIQSGGALKKRDQFVIDCAELSGAFVVQPDLAARYAGHQAVLIFDQQFVPELVDSIDTPKDLTRFPLVSREVIRFGIDAQGKVAACTRTKSEGDYKPLGDGCGPMRSRHFKPDSAGRLRLVPATATTAIYTYVK